MTLWCPDTCGCEITISDAQGTPEWAQPIEHLKVCADHKRLGYDHKDVLKENQRKNYAQNDAKQAHPDVDFAWSFDADRVLTLTAKRKIVELEDIVAGKNQQRFDAAYSALSSADKKTLQDQLEAKHGVGKVLVN